MSGLYLGSLTERIKRLSRKELDHQARYELSVGILNHILVSSSTGCSGAGSFDNGNAVDGCISPYLANAHLRQLAETLQHILLLDSEVECRKDARFWNVVHCAISQEGMDVGVVNRRLALAASRGLESCGEGNCFESVDGLAEALHRVFQTIRTRFTLTWLDNLPMWVRLLEESFVLEMKAVDSGLGGSVKNLSRLLQFLLEELLVFQSAEGVWASIVPSRLLVPALARFRRELSGECEGTATRDFLSAILFAKWHLGSFAGYLRMHAALCKGSPKQRKNAKKRSEKLHANWLFGELRNGIMGGALPDAVKASVATRLSIVKALPWMLRSCCRLLDASQEYGAQGNEPTLQFAAFVAFLGLLMPGVTYNSGTPLSDFSKGIANCEDWSQLLEPVGNLLTECMRIGAFDPTHDSYSYQLSIMQKLVDTIVMGVQQSKSTEKEEHSTIYEVSNRSLCLDLPLGYVIKPLLQMHAGLLFPHLELMLDAGISENCPAKTGVGADLVSYESTLELIITSYSSARMLDVFLDALIERIYNGAATIVAPQRIFSGAFLRKLQSCVHNVPIMQHTDIVSLSLTHMSKFAELTPHAAILEIAEIVLCVLQSAVVVVENSGLIKCSCEDYLNAIDVWRIHWESDGLEPTKNSSALCLALLKIRNSVIDLYEHCALINPDLQQIQQQQRQMRTPSLSRKLVSKFDLSDCPTESRECSTKQDLLGRFPFDIEALWKSVYVEAQLWTIQSATLEGYKCYEKPKFSGSSPLNSTQSDKIRSTCQHNQSGQIGITSTEIDVKRPEEILATLVADMYSCIPISWFHEMDKHGTVSVSFFWQERSSISAGCWAMLCQTYHIWAPHATGIILNEFMRCLLQNVGDDFLSGDYSGHLLNSASWKVLSHPQTYLIDQGVKSMVGCLGSLVLSALDTLFLQSGCDSSRNSWRELYHQPSSGLTNSFDAILMEEIEREIGEPRWQNVVHKQPSDSTVEKLISWIDLARRLPWESMPEQHNRALLLALGTCLGLLSIGNKMSRSLRGFCAPLIGWIAHLCVGRGLSCLRMKFILVFSIKSLQNSKGITSQEELETYSIIENLGTIALASVASLHTSRQSMLRSEMLDFLKKTGSKSCEHCAVTMGVYHGYLRGLKGHAGKFNCKDTIKLVVHLEEQSVRFVLDFMGDFITGSTCDRKMIEYCGLGSACHAVASCIDWHVRSRVVNDQFLATASCVPQLMEYALELHSKKMLELLPQFCLLGIMDLFSRMGIILCTFATAPDAHLWNSALTLHVIMLPTLPTSDEAPFFLQSVLSANDPLIVSPADSEIGSRLRKTVAMSAGACFEAYSLANEEKCSSWMTTGLDMVVDSRVGDSMYRFLQILIAGLSSWHCSKTLQRYLLDKLITVIVRILSKSNIEILQFYASVCLCLSLRGLVFLLRNMDSSSARHCVIECARLGKLIFEHQDKLLGVQFWIGPFIEYCSLFSIIAARHSSKVVEAGSACLLVSARSLFAALVRWANDTVEEPTLMKSGEAFVTASGKIAKMHAQEKKLVQGLIVEYCKAIASMREMESHHRNSGIIRKLFSGALEVYAVTDGKQRIALNTSELTGPGRIVLEELANENSRTTRFKRKT